MENPTTQLTKIFQTSPLLRDYIDKTQRLEKLTQIIRPFLEPELAKNCRVANLHNNILILAITSPAWNHRLKFLTPDLLRKLRSLPQYHGLTAIEVIQQSSLEITKKPIYQIAPIHISNANAKQITTLAKDITHPALSKALLKIANHAKNKDK